MNKLLTAWLLAGLCLLFPLTAAAAAPDETQVAWNISFVGDLKMPAGFAAVEVKDFRKLVDDEKNRPPLPAKTDKTKAKPEKPVKFPDGAPDLLKDAVPSDKDSLEDRLRRSDFALYHLTLDDGKSIHLAWFLAARDGDPIPAKIDFFSKEITPEQERKLDELKTWIDANIDKARYDDPKGKVSMKLLEVLPIKAVPAGGKQLWTTGARCLVTADEMPFAFYGKTYLLDVDGHLVVGVLAGLDGERTFWEAVLDAALENLAAGGKPAIN